MLDSNDNDDNIGNGDVMMMLVIVNCDGDG